MSGWAWAVFTILFALLLVNVWYCVEKVWELNRKHQRHVEEINHEFRMQTQMMKNLTLPMMEAEPTPWMSLEDLYRTMPAETPLLKQLKADRKATQ